MAKMGRPTKTDEPRDQSLHLRLSKSEMELLSNFAKKLGLNRAEAIVFAIQTLEGKPLTIKTK